MAAADTPSSLRKLRRAADHLAAELERASRDKQQLYRYLVTEKNGTNTQDTVEHIHEKADFKAAREMAAAMKELNGLLCDLYGLNDTNAQADNDIRVVLTGESADWAE